VVLFARNTKAARRLAEQFQQHTIDKVYWAAVEGRVTPAEGAWEDWLRKLADVCAEAHQRGDPLVAARSLAPDDTRIATAPSRPLPPRATPSNRSGTWARWAIAAQFAVIMVLGAALMPLHDGPAPYRTLGSTAAQADAGSIVVVFDPGITEAELRRILRIAGARVIDGPTQADAYVLSLAPERVGAALAMLQSQRAVLFAAPLGGTPQR